MSQAFKVAAIRGVIGGVLTAGAVFFAGLVGNETLRLAAIQAGAAAFSYLVIRFGAEGLIDTQAAGNVPPAMG